MTSTASEEARKQRKRAARAAVNGRTGTRRAGAPANSTAVIRCFEYARDAVTGRSIVCEKTRMGCRRFLDDLARAGQLAEDWKTAAAGDAILPPPERDTEGPDGEEWPWIFDAELAARPVDFMERFLKPVKGDYDRMELMGWQCFIECNLFGWVHRETGLRRFREALILVGKGNGKSTMMAGNATYMTCKDGEPGADIFLLANSKEQAGIVFEECKAEIDASPALRQRFRTLRDGVYYDRNRATIRHRSSDSKRLDGLNPHGAIFDEIHEYRDFSLLNIIKRSAVKRKQPLIIYITTMGRVIDGPLAQYYGLFTDAMNGTLDPKTADAMFAFIAEMDEGDDIEDWRLWGKANPGLGKTLQIETLRAAWERDRLIPSERADFICKQLNIMVNADDMAFVQPEVIRRNREHFDEEKLLGRRCYGGFDLSDREDFTAAALEFPLEDGKLFVKLHSWVPRRKVEANQEKIDYYGLAMKGLLTIVEGEYIQQEDIYEWFKAQGELYEIVTIGYDPANATRLRQMLENRYDCQVVRQGPITLNDPMKDIKEQLLAGNVISNEDPMLIWYTDNVRISGERRHQDKANWMPTKRNRFRKIDGFMAWLDAHCVRMEKEPAGQELPAPAVRVVEFGRPRRR